MGKGKKLFDRVFKEMRCPECAKHMSFAIIYWKCDFCKKRYIEFWIFFSLIGWIMVYIAYHLAQKYKVLGF
jgi:hypothetical protein